MQSARGRVRKWLGWLGSPWVLIGVVVAWTCLWVLTRGGERFLQPMVLGNPLLVERTSRGTVASDPNTESWDRATRAMSGTGENEWLVSMDTGVSRPGWPFPVAEQRSYEIVIKAPRYERTTDQMIRSAAVDEYARQGLIPDPSMASAMRSADVQRTRHLWQGWVCNAATLVAFLIAGYGLTQLPRHGREWRASRRRKQLASGFCPACGYRLEGLAGTTCPECGEGLNPPT